MARLNYLELPVRDVAATRDFYAAAFGWDFTAFGPDYASTMTGDTDVGINGDAAQWTAQLLPVIEVDDLEALKGYLMHPSHAAFGAHFTQSSSAALAYDYEMVDVADAMRLVEGS